VAAHAIVWAAHHRRRELLVGMPTAKAVWLDKFIPGLLDRYLARFGYASQMSPTFVAPGRPDNLFEPVRGDTGAHGRFDAEAKPSSGELWLATHPVVGLLALAGIAGGVFAWRGRHGGGELRKSRSSPRLRRI
jgi:hypothetical protein